MITISVAVTIVIYLCVSVLKLSRWGRDDNDDDHDNHDNDDHDDDNRNNEGGTLLEKMTVARLQSSANGTTWLTRSSSWPL